MFTGTNDDEDDSFFTPVSSSNLASLFGITMNQATSSPANTSLTYTAPKQPNTKKEEPPKPSPSKTKYKSSVIIFKEVCAYKFIPGEFYTSQGKFGLALVGNETVKIYQLLVYKQKNDIISTTKVNSNFTFSIQQSNFGSFSDDQNQNWNMSFNSEQDLNEFADAIKTRGGKIDNVAQNKPVTNVENNTIKQVTDKELLKETDNENQSDSSGNNTKANILSRMAKMGQRILIPNTSVSDGTDSDTDKDKSIQKVNRKSKRPTPAASVNSSPEISKKPVTLKPNTTMAVPTTVRQPTTFPVQYTIVNGQYVPIVQPPIVTVPGDISSAPQSVYAGEGVASPIMYTPPVHSMFDQFNMYFVENRTQNSEVRMNLLRLTNKMEEMLEKVQKLENKPSNTTVENTSKDCVLQEENEKLKTTISKLENSITETNNLLELNIQKNSELLEKENNLRKENEEHKIELTKHVNKEVEYLDKIKELESKLSEQSELLKSYEDKTNFENNKTEDNNSDKLFVNKEKFQNIDETIKKIMNLLYREVNEQFSDEETIQGRDVKKVVAQKIIDSTYNIITAVSELSISEQKGNMAD